jgi:hypothetical protein
MSLNINPMKVEKVCDPRLEIDEEKEYVALKGARVNSWQQFPATNVSNSSFQITCNPPSRDIAIARIVWKKVSFNWSVSGTNTSGGTLLNEGYFGPRALPLTCCTGSEQMTINNDTITQAPLRQYWRALLRYRNEWKDRFGQGSLAPSMLDQHQSYAEGVGGVRNPLGTYDDNSFEQTRASYVGFTVDAQTPGNTTATGTLTTYEPILMSPFGFGDRSNFIPAFAGVQNMSYNTTLTDLSRILSLVQGQGAPAGQIVLGTPVVDVASASLLMNYLTPDVDVPIPRKMETSYYSVVSYPTRTSAPIAPGGEVEIPLQSIQVTSIPKRIYVFAKRDDSEETAFTTDTYLALADGTPLQLTWNNNQFLSSATTQNLYNISVKNGVDLSYTQFADKTGSVVALDFGTDIGLEAQEAAGTIGNYQLGLRCRFKNTTEDTFAPTLYCVVVYEGVFNITDGSCSHMVGVLSPSDVLNAPRAPAGSYEASQDVYGGSWKMLGKLARSAHKFMKKHKVISKGLKAIPHPYAQTGSKVAEALGYGVSGGALPRRQGARTTRRKGVSLSSLAD